VSRSGWMLAWPALVLAAFATAQQPGLAPPPGPQWAIRTLQQHPQSPHRRGAARFLGRLYPPPPQALAALLGGLHDPDPTVVFECCRSLALLGSDAEHTVPAIVETIRQVLSETPAENQAQAAELIASLRWFGPGARPAVPLLAELVAVQDRPLRLAAMTVLQSMGPDARDAIAALNAVLKEPAPEGEEGAQATLRAHAAFTLWKITQDRKAAAWLVHDLAGRTPPLLFNRHPVLDLLGKMGPAAAEAAQPLGSAIAAEVAIEVQGLRRVEVPVRLQGLLARNIDELVMPALAEMGPGARAAAPAVTQWLATAPAREVPRARWRLPLRVLAAVGPEARDAIGVIEPLLAVRNDTLSLDAALALYRITGDAAPLARLTEVLEQGDTRMQCYALDCLARSGGKTAVPAIRALREHESAEVRGRAVLAWVKLDPSEEAVQCAGQMVQSRTNWEEVDFAAQALAAVGPRARPFGPDLRRAIAEAVNDRVRAAVLEALVRSGAGAAPVREDVPLADPRFAALVQELRRAGSKEIDPAVLEQIAALRPMPPESLALWTELLTRRDESLARTAACALGRLGPRAARAVDVLVQSGRAHVEPGTLEEILLALIAIGRKTPATGTFLVEMANHYDPHVRTRAVTGFLVLGVGSRDAVEALKRTMRQDDPELQVKAALALATLVPEETGVTALAAHLLPLNQEATSARAQRDAARALLRLARQGNEEAAGVLVRFVSLLAVRAHADRSGDERPAALRHVADLNRQAALVVTELSELPAVVRRVRPVLLQLYRDTRWPLALWPLIRHAVKTDEAFFAELLEAQGATTTQTIANAALVRLTRQQSYLRALADLLASADANARTIALRAAAELRQDARPLAETIHQMRPERGDKEQRLAETALWLTARDEEALASLVKRCEEAGDEDGGRLLAELARAVPETIPILRRLALEAVAPNLRLAVLEELSEIDPVKESER
jgi:hypothetical protein